MTIACLGWGSLIWRNEGLCCDQVWRPDGPMLPIEFARMSRGGEVTLVILEGVPPVPVLWSQMHIQSVAAARENLRIREGRTKREWIGYWSMETMEKFPCSDVIGTWAQSKGISGVVWTALPSKWGAEVGKRPTLPEITNHLSDLPPEARALARRYILEASVQIATPFRPALMAWARDTP